AQEVLDAGADRARPLDGVESKALVYLAAFDLARFDLGFALGTEHPRLEWSPRPPAASRDRRLPGPDGFDNAEPLVRTGLISPRHTSRVVATFTAGFKRRHGAFRYGELAQRNGGSHYGFIESGVVFSRLQPGLATLLVLDDGSVRMQTWRAEDEALLSRVMHARQNGVPIVVPGPADGLPLPGEEVAKWGPGNWSGSAEGKLRSLRGGACLQKNGQRRYLIYGYFSSATPSAMARVFQAYGCSYAMKLDMNALEHTYMAVYHRSADRLEVEHLVDGMSVLDKQADGRVLPRFLGLPDNRDFFYLLAREAPQNGLRTADR
ncbi:MAG: hypothetical protein KDK91_16550, partial [Gammaproteobacteria bacterium]|nr:hypothetical protein [Gammaproteobacteria bacterium]